MGTKKISINMLLLLIVIATTTYSQSGNGNMIYVEGGSFNMGSNDGETDEMPVHKVTVNSFYIGKIEVTIKEYRVYCNDTGLDMPAQPRTLNDNDPVVNISWNDAQGYCKWAKVRLPTEAEWEYAANGGNKSRGTKYSGSDNIDEVGWYKNNSNLRAHLTGQKKANELNIFDMTGNVWEWCEDLYSGDYYKNSPELNPKGPNSGPYRILRGGSWLNIDVNCQIANRDEGKPDDRGNSMGFRVAHD